MLHTAINFWSSIIPVLPTGEGYRPYGLLVAMLVLVALVLMVLMVPLVPLVPQKAVDAEALRT